MRSRCARPRPRGSWRALEDVGARGRRVVPVSAGTGPGVLAGVIAAGAGGPCGSGSPGALTVEAVSAGASGSCGSGPPWAPAVDAMSAGAGDVLVAGGRVAAGPGAGPAVGGPPRGRGRTVPCAPRARESHRAWVAATGAGGVLRPRGPVGSPSADGGVGPSGPRRLAGGAAAHRRPRTGTAGGTRGGIGSVRAPRATACCSFRRGCRILEVWSLSGTSRASGKRAEGEGAGDECRRTCS